MGTTGARRVHESTLPRERTRRAIKDAKALFSGTTGSSFSNYSTSQEASSEQELERNNAGSLGEAGER